MKISFFQVEGGKSILDPDAKISHLSIDESRISVIQPMVREEKLGIDVKPKNYSEFTTMLTKADISFTENMYGRKGGITVFLPHTAIAFREGS